MKSSSQEARKGNAETGTPKLPVSAGVLVPGMTLLDNDSAHNFSKLGEEYLEAAKILNRHYADSPKWPTFFLGCTALELYLKAFLRFKGVSIGDLKSRNKFGHDLMRRFSRSKELGLAQSFEGDLEFAIEKLNEYYRDREFQYAGSGSWELVPPSKLIALLEELGCKLRY